jgi:FkbM family methyltransferase
MFSVLRRLYSKGVRCTTIIDVGCADGHFGLHLLSQDLARGSSLVNIDANPLYESSLKSIADIVGGHYLIAALMDFEGEIDINTGAHHYWASALPDGDKYWLGQHGVTGNKLRVPTTTLDALSKKLRLRPPYMLKFDVQGLEETVLRGGAELLKQTSVVICEAGMDNFNGINAFLVEKGFILYDLVQMMRDGSGTLIQFYPIYVKKELGDVLVPVTAWSKQDQAAVIAAQTKRRAEILKWNADFLARYRKAAPMSKRNEPCPCGSGRRYKHCCGSHGGATA